MRKLIDIAAGYILNEAFLDNAGHEEAPDVRYADLPASSALKVLRPLLAAASQPVYDDWEIKDGDEIGFEDEYAGGGICHLIADKMAEVLDQHGIPCRTVSSSYEQHVFCVAQCCDGVFEVDIPHRIYEIGGGFRWKRIDGVTFCPDDVAITCLDHDPASVDAYWGAD